MDGMICNRFTLLSTLPLLGALAIGCPASDDGTTGGGATEPNGNTEDPTADDQGPGPGPTTADPPTTTAPDPTTADSTTDDDGPDSTGEESTSTGEPIEPRPCQAEPYVIRPDITRSIPGLPAADIEDLHDDVDPLGGGGFIPPGGGGPAMECDPIAQDCPQGEKCMPWANDGGAAWNATRCSPIVPNPQAVGEPCMVEGSGVSGIDNCDIGAMCWGVDDNNMGTCIEMCGGTYENPTCDTQGAVCSITNMGALTICQTLCNPLASECAGNEGCYLVNGLTVCAPDASGDQGAAGDPCEFLNACDDGLVCLEATATPGCVGSGCCTPYCDTNDGSECPRGQSCAPLYMPGTAPLRCVDNLGVCTATP